MLKKNDYISLRSFLVLIHRNKFNRTMSGKDDQARVTEREREREKTRNEQMIIQVTIHRTVTGLLHHTKRSGAPTTKVLFWCKKNDVRCNTKSIICMTPNSQLHIRHFCSEVI